MSARANALGGRVVAMAAMQADAPAAVGTIHDASSSCCNNCSNQCSFCNKNVQQSY